MPGWTCADATFIWTFAVRIYDNMKVLSTIDLNVIYLYKGQWKNYVDYSISTFKL